MLNLETYLHYDSCKTFEETGKVLRTQFQDNEVRFNEDFIKPLDTWLNMNDIENKEDIIALYKSLWSNSTRYSYKEAFAITEANLRALVFSYISIVEMIENLGTELVEKESIELLNEIYGQEEKVKLTQSYEVHKVNGQKLDLTEPIYALRCWCPGTGKEHWLWINEKKSPLEAVAGNAYYFEEMEGKIRNIVRQGDTFYFEMNEEVEITENSKIKPMTKEMYFNLLTQQT